MHLLLALARVCCSEAPGLLTLPTPPLGGPAGPWGTWRLPINEASGPKGCAPQPPEAVGPPKQGIRGSRIHRALQGGLGGPDSAFHGLFKISLIACHWARVLRLGERGGCSGGRRCHPKAAKDPVPRAVEQVCPLPLQFLPRWLAPLHSGTR